MTEPKPRTCVGCGNVGFKGFKLRAKFDPTGGGWFCADCHGEYKNRPAASREEMETTLAALREAAARNT